MDLGPLRQLASEIVFDTHGVAAIVTRPWKAPISTKGIWREFPSNDQQPVGRELFAREPRWLMELRRDEVAEVELGTVIEAPDPFGSTTTKYWQIDGIEETRKSFFVVRLVPKTDANTWD